MGRPGNWTWPGYEGKNANVDVYSNADEAGELKAVSYVNGEETGIDVQRTAKAQVQLTLDCREKELEADGEAMAVVRSAREPGEIKVTFQAQGCAEQVITIPVVAQG